MFISTRTHEHIICSYSINSHALASWNRSYWHSINLFIYLFIYITDAFFVRGWNVWPHTNVTRCSLSKSISSENNFNWICPSAPVNTQENNKLFCPVSISECGAFSLLHINKMQFNRISIKSKPFFSALHRSLTPFLFGTM